MTLPVNYGDGTGIDKHVDRLILPEYQPPKLPPQQPAAPIGPGRGVGKSPAPQAGGAGAAGNLTEQSRTYYTTQVLTSSDGLFTIEVKPIKTLVMVDASSNAVTWTFANAV